MAREYPPVCERARFLASIIGRVFLGECARQLAAQRSNDVRRKEGALLRRGRGAHSQRCLRRFRRQNKCKRR